MRNRITKIGALVVLGLLILVSLSPAVSADTTIGDDDSKVEVVDEGDGYILMEEDNTEYFRLTGGNIGIGVIDPAEKLEINGNLKFTEGADRIISVGDHLGGHGYDLTIEAGNGNHNTLAYRGGDLRLTGGEGCGGMIPGGLGGNVYVYGGYGTVGGSSPGDVILAHDGTRVGGNVGIGTSSPNAALDVGGGSGTLADGEGDVLISGDLEVDDDVQIDGGAITTSVATTWDLADSFTTSLNIESGLLNLDTSNSRIGIGTTSPQLRLHIYDGNAGTDPTWDSDDIAIIESDGNAYLQFFVPDSSVSSGIMMSDPSGRAAGGIHYQHANDKLLFRSNGANNMVLDSNGNVGIGTTSPDYEITIGDGTNERIHFSADTNPASDPPSGSVLIYFDGTDLIARDSSGAEISITSF